MHLKINIEYLSFSNAGENFRSNEVTVVWVPDNVTDLMNIASQVLTEKLPLYDSIVSVEITEFIEMNEVPETAKINTQATQGFGKMPLGNTFRLIK